RRTLARCSTSTPRPAAPPKAITGHGYPRPYAKGASDAEPRIDDTDAYRVTANTISHTPTPAKPSSGATPRNAPPAVATIFPPFWKARKIGRQCPSIAAAPASTPLP